VIRRLLLGLSVALALAFASSLPDKPPFTNPVTVKFLEPGAKLESVIRSIARSAGVPVLLRGLPDEVVVLEVKGVPFKRLLDLLLRVYAPNHAYALLPEGVLLVAPKEVVGPPRQEAPAKGAADGGKPVEGTMGVVLPTNGVGEELAEAAKKLGVEKVSYVAKADALILYGPVELLERAVPILRRAAELARPSGEPQASAPSPPPPPPSPPPPPLEEARARSKVSVIRASLPRDALDKVAKALGLEGLVEVGEGVYLAVGPEEAVREAERTLSSLRPSSAEAPTTPAEVTVLVQSGIPKESTGELAKALGLSALVPLGDGSFLVKGEEPAVASARRVLESVKPQRPAGLVFQIPSGVPEDAAKAAVEALLPGAKVGTAGRVLTVAAASDQDPKEVKALVESALSSLSPAPEPDGYLTKAYPIYGDPEEVAKGLEAVIPSSTRAAKGYRVEVLKGQKALVLRAPYEVHVLVVDYLKQVDPPKGEGGEAQGQSIRKRLALNQLKPQDAVKALERSGIGVRATADEVANAVWLEGAPSEVGKAIAYLSLVYTKPPQVKLGVRVTQVERSALSQLDPGMQMALNSLGVQIGSSGIGLGYTLPVNLASSLVLSLQSLEGKGLAKTLVDTQALVLDGKEAVLISGGTVYVLQSGQGEGGGSGGAAGGGPAGGMQNIEYGLVVKLTPRVHRDGEVEIETTLELGGLPNQGPVANTIDVSKKKLQGVLRLKEGRTGLLGGLIYQEDGEREQGVPILSQIPLIGELFKSKSSSRKETVLLVLLTPIQVEVPPVPAVLSIPGEELPGSGGGKGKEVEDPRTPPEPKGPGGPGVATSTSTPVSPPAFRPEPLLDGYVAKGFRSSGGYVVYVGGGTETFKARVTGVFGAYRKGESLYASPLSYRTSGDAFGSGRAIAVLVGGEGYDEVYLAVEDAFGRKGFVKVDLR